MIDIRSAATDSNAMLPAANAPTFNVAPRFSISANVPSTSVSTTFSALKRNGGQPDRFEIVMLIPATVTRRSMMPASAERPGGVAIETLDDAGQRRAAGRRRQRNQQQQAERREEADAPGDVAQCALPARWRCVGR